MKTFKDHETDLEWLLEDFGPMTWDKAMELNVSGFTLPTEDQLLTLRDTNKINPACSKPVDITSYEHWTSTSYALFDTSAWYVDFFDSNVSCSFKTNSYYVKLVRPLKKNKDEYI